jgi:hypothetical protein
MNDDKPKGLGQRKNSKFNLQEEGVEMLRVSLE